MRLGMAVVPTLVLALAAPAAAQSFAGSYTTVNQAGNTVSLELRQDAAGAVTGSIAAAGFQARIEGVVQEGAAMGRVMGENSLLFFYAEMDGNGLVFSLLEPDAQGAPNYDSAQELAFTRAAAAPGAAAGPAPTPVPGAAGPPGPVQRNSALVGAWASQEVMNSGDASMSVRDLLEFRPDGLMLLGSGGLAGGGPGWSAVGGEGGPTQQVLWRTAADTIYVAQPGSNQWEICCRYYVEGNRMLITNLHTGGRRVWHRR